jgi:malate dehydrogenase (oxaloacetate-decarboxylating)(NADP+)
MQVRIAMIKELRDTKYPFSRIFGKEVNTEVFSYLNDANSAYKMLQALTADLEIIGPIRMGLNKPIHFIDFESSVQDIVNVTAVAAIDAMVNKK